MNPFVDLAKVSEMAIVKGIGKHLFGYLIYRPWSTATSYNAISRQKVSDVHDSIVAGGKHLERLPNNECFLVVNGDGFGTRVIEVSYRRKSGHFSSSDFLAKASLGVFRERVHEVFTLPKTELST